MVILKNFLAEDDQTVSLLAVTLSPQFRLSWTVLPSAAIFSCWIVSI